MKQNKLCHIIGPKAQETKDTTFVGINQNVNMYASLLKKGAVITHKFEHKNGYIHVCMTGGSLTVKGADGNLVSLKGNS